MSSSKRSFLLVPMTWAIFVVCNVTFNYLTTITDGAYKQHKQSPIEKPTLATNNSSETIQMGVIATNFGGEVNERSTKYKVQFASLLLSILRHSQSADSIRLLVLTDNGSRKIIELLLKRFWRTQNERELTYELFDTADITDKFKETIRVFQQYFTSATKQGEKYRDDLFMLAPFFHLVLPTTDRLIMLDLDIQFRVDLRRLHEHFDSFSEEQLLGVSSDLSPHYSIKFGQYRSEHPETQVGETGPFQGFNTGVVLYRLDRMRKSKLLDFADKKSVSFVTDLADKYAFKSDLGDQCLFTLLGMEFPDLFYRLPCQFNYQLDIRYSYLGDIFKRYYSCSEEPLVLHGNGGSEIPFDSVELEQREEVITFLKTREVEDNQR